MNVALVVCRTSMPRGSRQHERDQPYNAQIGPARGKCLLSRVAFLQVYAFAPRHARSQIAKLFSNDQLETPRAAVSIKEEPTPNEEQPAHRGTVNSRDLVASLERASGFSISAWQGRIVPSWCRGLNHPNPSVCGPVHLISQVTKLPKDLKSKSHVHLVRTSSP